MMNYACVLETELRANRMNEFGVGVYIYVYIWIEYVVSLEQGTLFPTTNCQGKRDIYRGECFVKWERQYGREVVGLGVTRKTQRYN